MTITTELATAIETRLLIDGQWQPGLAGSFTAVNPATEQILTEVACASPADIDAAVAAARAQLTGEWGGMSGAVRGQILYRAADLVERDAEQLARLEALDIGKPYGQALGFDVPNVVATLRHFAGWADKINGETIPTAGFMGRKTLSYSVREPVGVIGAITPWNSPLMITVWKLAPALAAGNTMVIKPPEDAPLSTLHLGRLLLEAGLPGGVVNIVPGLGPEAGQALVDHPGVDKISFTGSPGVGRQIQIAAAAHFKRTTLELGGKSPQVVFADADIEAAVASTAMGIFINQGEVCAAASRILVHRKIYREFTEGMVAAARSQVLGDPFDPATTMGALINARQRDRVLGYVETGRGEGATLAAGGRRPDHPGYYVEPTIFTDVDNTMRIAQEEIFGPVGVVIPFDDTAQAIKLANDTPYGLASTIWTRDVSRAHEVAARIEAGTVWVNGWGPLDPALSWGGLKESGVGRELGRAGILANTEEKVITIVL